jgi:hypothetical protein
MPLEVVAGTGKRLSTEQESIQREVLSVVPQPPWLSTTLTGTRCIERSFIRNEEAGGVDSMHGISVWRPLHCNIAFIVVILII